MPFAVFVLPLVILLLGPAGLPAKEAGTLTFQIHGERLTLQANEVPLAAILARLATATGITISLRDIVDEHVSVDLVDVSFNDGLRRLLQQRNTVFLYDQYQGKLSAIYVFGLRGGAATAGASAQMEISAAASAQEEDGEVEWEARRFETTLAIETLEGELRATAEEISPAMSSLLHNLLTDAEPAIRATTLHWVVDRRAEGTEALAAALMDSDTLVQNVAMQILLDRGIDDQAVEEIRAAAEAGNEAIVLQTLSHLTLQ